MSITAQSSRTDWPKSVLVFAYSVDGGIPIYVHHQAEELAKRGIAVTMLCPANHPAPREGIHYRQLRLIPEAPSGRGLIAKANQILNLLAAHYRLLWWILRLRPSAVLLDSVIDFCAIFWVLPHLALARFGLPYATTLHDPVRALWYGPKWFDKLSLWSSYRLLDAGLIHGTPPPGAYLPKHLTMRVVPHGLFDRHEPDPNRNLRRELGIAENAYILLSFGHIADRKNQHLLVQAVARVQQAVLIIAGPQMAQRNRPPQFYRDLAHELGCAERVYVIDRFIKESEVGQFFAAADAVALTYEAGFVSQSGVLQVAAQWDKPVLASAADGPLREAVEHYDIGVFVTPDSADAIVQGLSRLAATSRDHSEGFAALRRAASWEANIDGLLEALREAKGFSAS